MKFENTLRSTKGEDLITRLGSEYYDSAEHKVFCGTREPAFLLLNWRSEYHRDVRSNVNFAIDIHAA
jgi:hypothetical protein